MYELEEKGYFYLLLVIPVLTLVFLYLLYWKRKKQREFGDLNLIEKIKSRKIDLQTYF
jgi:Ca-activated chloride channel family protein